MDRTRDALIDVYREQQRSVARGGGGDGEGARRGARLQLAQPKGRGDGEIRIGLG